MINIYVSRDINQHRVLFAKIRENLMKNIDSYYIVPDQYTLFSDINLIKSLDINILMDTKVKSFASFSNEILSNFGGLKQKVLTENGKKMLVQKILLENEGQLKILGRNARSKGFAGELSKAIGEIKEATISCNLFKEKINDLGHINKNKLEDLSLIYGKYENEIKDKYIDSNDRLNVLWERLDEAEVLKDKVFFFDKFNSLSSQELQIIAKLDSMGCELNFFLLIDPKIIESGRVDIVEDGEVFDLTYGLYKKLKEINKDLNLVELETSLDSEQGFLASNLLSYNPQTYMGQVDGIRTIKCKNTEEEIGFACEIIKKYIIENKYRYRDFALIITDDEYKKYIKRIFTKEAIPYFIDSKDALLNNNFAGFLTNVLMLIVKNFRPQDITSFLKFCNIPSDRSKLEVFESYLYRRKIRGLMIFNDAYFGVNQTYLESKDQVEIEKIVNEIGLVNEVRSEFLTLIKQFYLDSKNLVSINDHIRSLFKFLLSEPIKVSIESFLEGQEDDEGLKSANDQVWDYFINTINELAEIQGTNEVSFEDFARILISGFEEQSIGIIPPCQDVVFVGSMKRTRISPTKIIFIIGMSENYFPSSTDIPSIIDENEKMVLRDQGLNLPIKAKEFKAEEILNLYSNILMAEEALFFSTANMDSANTTLNDSMYYNQIAKIMKKIDPVNSDKFFKEIIYSKTLVKDQVISKIQKLSEKPEAKLGQKEIDVFSYLYGQADKDLWSGLKGLDPNLSALDKKLADKLYASDRVSISRIETFARCPYKHFVSYGLSPSESLDYSIERREFGSLAHKSISRFVDKYRKKPEEFSSLKEEEFKKKVYQIIDEDTETIIDKTRSEDEKNQILLGLAKDRTFEGIKNVYRHLVKSKFTTYGSELSFGVNEQIPPLIIDLGGRLIELGGIVDRVDVYKDGPINSLMVIDYKTGTKEFDLSLSLAGIDIQLPVYFKAMTNFLPNARGVGFFYLPIRDDFLDTEEIDKEKILSELIKKLALDGLIIDDEDIIRAIDRDFDGRNSEVLRLRGNTKNISDRNNVFDESTMDCFIEDIIKLTESNIEKIFAGLISPFPYIKGQVSECVNCEYQNICKFDFKKDKTYRSIKNVTLKGYKDDKTN